MAPLSAAGKTAHEAFWALRHGRFQLHPDLVQKLLVDHFAARGEAVIDLPVDVDRDDTETWAQEWRDRASDAGVTGKADTEAIINLLKARTAAGQAAKPQDQAQLMLDTLVGEGATLRLHHTRLLVGPYANLKRLYGDR